MTGRDVRSASGWLRSASSEALFAYAAAFALTFGACFALVLAVGVWRALGHRALVASETQAFAWSAWGLMACALVESAVLAGVGLATARGQRDWGGRAHPGPNRATLKATGAAVLGMVGLSAACGAAAELVHLRVAGVTEALGRALESATPARLLCAVVCIGLAPAVAEEVFFRGVLLPRLSRAWGSAPGIAATALAFGLFHLDGVQGAVACVAGLFLGWVAERFGSVRPCIAAHATNNVLFVGLAAMGFRGGSPWVQAWVLVGGALALGAAIVMLRSPAAPQSAAPPQYPLS